MLELPATPRMVRRAPGESKRYFAARPSSRDADSPGDFASAHPVLLDLGKDAADPENEGDDSEDEDADLRSRFADSGNGFSHLRIRFPDLRSESADSDIGSADLRNDFPDSENESAHSENRSADSENENSYSENDFPSGKMVFPVPYPGRARRPGVGASGRKRGFWGVFGDANRP